MDFRCFVECIAVWYIMWRFLKDFFIYGFASVFGKIAAVFLMPIYTSILTREEYGAMAMLVSVKGIIDLVSNLNIHSGIARDYYEENIDRKVLVSTGMWSMFFISCSVLVIMLLTRNYWLETVLGLHGYGTSFVLLLLSIPAGSLMSYFSILTRFKKKPLLFSFVTIISLLLQISIAIYTIVILRKGIEGFFLATLISEIFSISCFAFINREFIAFKFKLRYLKNALIFCLPLLPAILAGWLDTSFGQILMGKHVSLEDLGVYSVALQLASVFTLIGMAFHNVWSPFLYENYKRASFQQEVNRLFLVFVFALCLISCTLSLLSKEIILFLSNPNYINASTYITLLCIPMSVYLLFPMASSGISISRDTKHTSIAYILGSVFNLMFLYLLLPKLGAFTVPLGLGLSRVITYLYLGYVTHKKGLLILPNRALMLIFISVFVCFCLIYNQIDIVYRLLALIMINGILLYIADKRLGLKNVVSNIIRKKFSKNT